MDDELRKRMLDKLQAPARPALERTRSFLSLYLHDGDDMADVEARVRSRIRSHPWAVVDAAEAIEEVLAGAPQDGTLARLVSVDGNLRLDDPSDRGAAEWLRDLAVRLRGWLADASAPPVPALVVEAMRALADRAANVLPTLDAFDALEQPIDVAQVELPGVDWAGRHACLLITPYPPRQLPPGAHPQRVLQVRVTTRSGNTASSKWLIAGSRENLVDYLRDASNAPGVLAVVQELAEAQRRQGLS